MHYELCISAGLSATLLYAIVLETKSSLATVISAFISITIYAKKFRNHFWNNFAVSEEAKRMISADSFNLHIFYSLWIISLNSVSQC